MKKILLLIVMGAIIFICGFFMGRSKSSTETKIEYIPQKTIKAYIDDIAPTRVEVPKAPVLPTKKDTMYIDSIKYVTQHVDTAEIIRQYVVRNHYSKLLFDNESGKLQVDISTQYNLISSLSYEFTGQQKEITRTVEKQFTPFVTAGYSTNNSYILGFGAYWKNIAIEYNYNRGMAGGYHSIKSNYKF